VENLKDFEEQVKATYRSLKLFLQYLGVPKADVPDLAQEVYIKALKAFKVSYDPARPFKTWLFAIAKNTLIDWKRNKETKKNTIVLILPQPLSVVLITSFSHKWKSGNA
jgi:RNA polymerase sigma factor (sigma-70 family)